MENSLKNRSFKIIYWLMLILLTGDTIDTIYRFIIIGYLGEGTTFPGIDSIIKPNFIDLIVFTIFQILIIYGIFLLYQMKKFGGYLFIGSQLAFLFYASIFGPIAEIGITNILLPITIFFCLYLLLVIIVPWFYSDEFH